MKRLGIVMVFLGGFVMMAAASQAAHAQAALPEAQIEQIRGNCVTAQSTLTRIHASDGLLRVNSGRLYEIFSTKLMAPLNSRIALGRHGGLKLSAITIEYDRQLDIFRSSYIQYEDTMSKTRKIDCVEKPVEFYESIQLTREQRQKLHEDSETLVSLLESYRAEFEIFAKEFDGASE